MIYFDNAATTDEMGNPSSPHGLGIQAERAVASATEKLANIIGCYDDEIVYTSGGTESNNLALLGAAEAFARRGGLILTTPYEHPSVLEPLRYVKSKGKFELVECPVSSWPDYLGDRCVLVSCTQVNHETGNINDLDKISAMVKNANGKTIFHSDGSQGFCKVPMRFENVDMYTFSAHKFHGPAGMGGLVVKRGTSVKPLLFGGGQQRALRPGTLNVPGIINMVDAVEASASGIEARWDAVLKVKMILAGLADELPDVYINETRALTENAEDISSPFILNISFMGIRGETLVNALSGRGICASMGAACRSGKKGASPLELMGFNKDRANSAVRFSFWNNTEAETKRAKKVIADCVKELRSVKQNRK